MEKVYQTKAIENRLYEHWEKAGYFQPSGDGPVFSMVIPPPNVTGVLHMGHALNTTLQDIIARYKRMQGFRVLWVPGTDHAGIATQNVVEKQLKADGKNRHEFGREAFVDRVWQWKKDYGGRIVDQIRRLGASVDWHRERFTMDPGLADAVKETFVSLYEKGLIYQGHYIINWCPRCHTALSDIEVEYADTRGHLWEIGYPVVGGSDDDVIVVATTRPETMFGDTALAVHPNDERYADWIGKSVRIPLNHVDIPIVADTHVDRSFGTGAVKVTPAHDPNDYDIGKRHDLAQVLVMDEDAKMLAIDRVPNAYHGLTREACRKNLIADLDEQGFLQATRDHDLSKGHCYRCQTIVEPYLSKQWFVSMASLAKPAIAAVRDGAISFTPKRWEKLYFEWMETIRDWCISRQIWWGHRIPVWYCADHPDVPIVSRETPTECPTCQSKDLRQDDDVLDTWFSSALWPFSTLGWPEKSQDVATFYPNSMLVTGYDIITFWVSRMITMGLENTGQIPFSDVYIHGLVRDINGKKMSKSLGNAVDPLELIDRYGTDALRFSLTSLSTLGGQDIKFSDEKVAASRNFANKIWNATRYLMMVLRDVDPVDLSSLTFKEKDLATDWILSHLERLKEDIRQAFDTYNYARASDLLWEFTWNKYCDWLLEISKDDKAGYADLLIYILVDILKLMHPIMPFITDELWRVLRRSDRISGLEEASIMVASWPSSDTSRIDAGKEAVMDTVIAVTREIRRIRAQVQVAPKTPIALFLVSTRDRDLEVLKKGHPMLGKLANVRDVVVQASKDGVPKLAASGVFGRIEVYVPLDGLIDVGAEQARLKKRLDKLMADLVSTQQKLSNDAFTSKAPKTVVQQFRDQAETLETEKSLLEAQIAQLSA